MEYIEPISQNSLIPALLIAVFCMAMEWWKKRRISSSYADYILYAEDLERSALRFNAVGLMLTGVAFLDIILDQIRREEYSRIVISVLVFVGVVGVTFFNTRPRLSLNTLSRTSNH